ncbi:MAG: hypothetical protein K8M05_05675 [Deltaproteobacteria bacterium]|nr:hypothetical protein [Kofleriaceae bacterium]
MREFLGGWSRAFAVVCVTGGAVACGGGPDAGEAPPLPSVTFGPSDDYVVARFGEPFTLTATLTDASGAPATDYTWEWLHANDGATAWPLAPTTGGPGVEQVTFSARSRQRSRIYGRVTTCGAKGDRPCYYRNELETAAVDVVVWGGAAVAVHAPVTEVELVIGEARALGAVPVAGDGDGGLVYSDDRLAYTSGDPGVVTVGQDGVLTGVGAGTTTITATAGSASTTVNVTVAAGAPAAIPDGIHTLVDHRDAWMLAPGAQRSKAAVPYAVALSPTAGPFVIANVANAAAGDRDDGGAAVYSREGKTAYGRFTLARWTGSGFGFELPGEPWDVALDPMVALDERDRLYMVYKSENRRQYVILERAADAGPGTETMRVLPSDLVEPGSLGARVRDYLAITDERIELSAIAPRRGGGLWVAYDVYAGYASGPLDEHVGDAGVLPERCQVAGLLAEVTDTAIDVRQVSSDFFAPSQGRCENGVPPGSMGRNPSMWLTLDPEGGVPGTHFDRGEETRIAGMVTTSAAYRSQGGSHEVAGELDAIAGLETSGGVMTISARGTLLRATPIPSAVRSPGATGYERTWSDSMWPELGVVPPFTSAAEIEQAPVGWGHSIDHVATLHEGGLADARGYTLTMVRLPRAVSWSADEAAGRRFNGELNSPGIVDPPVVLADGSRYWLSRHVGTCDAGQPLTQGLWRSTGPGARPELVTAKGASNLHYDQPLRAVGSTLYAVRREQLGNTIGFVVRGSSDGGVTWTDASSYTGQMLSSELRAFATLPSGAGFAIMNGDGEPDFRVMVTANVATGPWTALPGFTAAQQPSWAVHHTNRDGFGLVPDGAGNMWVLVGALGNGAGGLLARRYSAAGAVLAELLVNVPATGTSGVLSVRAMTATTLVDGKLVVLGVESAVGSRHRLVSIVIDPSTQAVTRSVVVPDGVVGRLVPMVRTGDGRVVIGAQRSEALGSPASGYTTIRDRAVLWSSTDGLTWSAPKVLRPDGGNGQVVWSMGLDADGTLLIVVGDTGGYRSAPLLDTAYLETPLSQPATCDVSLVTPALMRTTAP